MAKQTSKATAALAAPAPRSAMGSRPAIWPIALVLLLTLAIGWQISERAILPASHILSWDEALHSLHGLRLADDLRRGDFFTFAYDSYRQVLWPPLHAWYLAGLFLLFGPSSLVAGLSSLLPLLGSVAVAYATGGQLAAADGEQESSSTLAEPEPLAESRPVSELVPRFSNSPSVAGLVAAVSLLCAGGVLIMASLVMLELPGLFWLTVCFYLYARTWRTGSRTSSWCYVLLGLAVMATYLTRSNYGVLIALALTVACLIDGHWFAWFTNRGRQDRLAQASAGGASKLSPESAELAARRRGHVLAALALAVPLLVWFAYPPKITRTLINLANYPAGPDRFSWEGLLYYPKALLWLAGSWPLLVAWLLAIVLTLLTFRLKPRYVPGQLRLLVIFIVLQFLFGELAVNKQARFILPLVPAFALLTGYWAGYLWSTWTSRTSRRRAGARSALAVLPSAVVRPVAVLAGLGLLWAHLTAASGMIGRANYYSVGEKQLIDLLVQDLNERGPALILGAADIWVQAAYLDWSLVISGKMPVALAGTLVHGGEERFLASLGRLPGPLQQPFRPVIERYTGPTSGKTYTAYVGIPLDDPSQFSPANYRQRVESLLAHRPADRILAVVDDPGQRFPELTPALVTGELAELGFAAETEHRFRFGEIETHVLSFKRAR